MSISENQVMTLCSFSLAVSLACGWTETSTTAGVTPVKHLGTLCSQKRRISMCRTQKSGLLSNKTVHLWGKKTSPWKGKGRSPRPLEQWQRPKPNRTSPGLPRLEASYRMLVVRYYCSYYRAFFFFVEKLPLCVSCYSLVQRFCRVGGVCKAMKIMVW